MLPGILVVIVVDANGTADVVIEDANSLELYAVVGIYASTGNELIVLIVSVLADILIELTVPDVVIKEPDVVVNEPLVAVCDPVVVITFAPEVIEHVGYVVTTPNCVVVDGETARRCVTVKDDICEPCVTYIVL